MTGMKVVMATLGSFRASDAERPLKSTEAMRGLVMTVRTSLTSALPFRNCGGVGDGANERAPQRFSAQDAKRRLLPHR